MKKIILFVFVAAAVCKTTGSFAQATNVQDSLALVDLYNNTGGTNWTHKDNWLTSAPINTWYGITTVIDTTERVSTIYLVNNNLTGFIPLSIGNLSLLGHINLSNNNLKGIVPDALISLQSLGAINIANNQFTDTIPADIVNYYFDTLNFSSNKFTFESIEPILAKHTVIIDTLFGYYPQASIPIHYNAGELSVSAGGTYSNNTYNWYRNDTLLSSIAGDSIFLVSIHGKYYAKITNSVATRLTLQSDTFTLAKDTVIPAPVILSFSPTIAGGGTTITIKGHYFTDCFLVSFGNDAAASFRVVSDSVVTAVVSPQGATGNVVVETPAGKDTASGFTFVPLPEIISFIPSYGKAGDTILISGSHFTNVSSVDFGDSAAASFSVSNDSLIKAVLSTKGASGYVSVGGIGGKDSLGGFIFLDSLPFISGFSPTAAAGGDTVTIRGGHFLYCSSVSFGNDTASSFSVISDSVIKAIVSTLGASGNIEVITPTGSVSAPGFVFIVTPKITSFTPSSGKTGDTIFISGKHFTSTSLVTFGDTAAAYFTVVNDSLIKATLSLGGASGYISVTAPGGTDSLVGFTFYPFPVIASFTPASASEGVTVSINGENFTNASSVEFGNLPAESFTVVSDNLITAVVGKGSSGSIFVTTKGGIAAIAGFISTPVITSFYPTSGPINTLVTINGYNFNDTAQNNIVYMGGIKTTVVSATDSSLIVRVPTGATTSFITETINYLTAATSSPFIITFQEGTFTDSTFASRVSYPATYASDFQIADFDNDGKQDLTVTTESPYEALVFRNTSAINSISLDQPIGESSTYQVSRAFLIDINGDGKIDLAVGTGGDLYGTSVYENQSLPGSISFAPALTFQDNSLAGTYVASGDLDGDGKPDIIIGGAYGTLYILQNTSTNGTISFNYIGQIETYSANISCMLLKDIDGDGKLDLLVGDRGGGLDNDTLAPAVAIYQNVSTNGNFGFLFQAKLHTATGNPVAEEACADLNGDGKPDIIFSDGAAHYIYKNNATPGNFAFSLPQIVTGSGTNGIGVGDLDGDGKLDLAIANGAGHTVSVFKNTSTTDSITFAPSIDYTTGLNPQNVAIADMDNDGKPDILVINNGDSTFSILRNNIQVEKLDSLILPSHPRIEYADRQYTDTSGWTDYYWDNNTPNDYTDDTLLLSLNTHGQNIGTLGDGTFAVKLVATAGAGSGTGIELTNPLITNPTGFWVMNRYWLVTPTTEPTTNVGVRFYYNNQDLADVNGSYPAHNLTNQQLIFYKEIGGNPDPTTDLAGATGLISILNSTYASDTTWTYHQISDTTQYAEFSVASFSGGGGGGTGNDQALPIKLLTFTATKEGSKNLLQWTTGQEVNSSYFEVERSGDGVNYKAIGQVNGAGNSSVAKNYSLVDSKPVNGINYYRLKMMDKDGKFSYSLIRTINEAVSFGVSIYPNPVVNNLNLSFNSDKEMTVQVSIVDNEGKVVAVQQMQLAAGASTQEINVGRLSSGVYYVRVVGSEGETEERFVKK